MKYLGLKEQKKMLKGLENPKGTSLEDIEEEIDDYLNEEVKGGGR